jgi:hypothetical protein
MPPDEHPVGQVQQFLPDGCPAVLPINHRLKVPTQMGPTELPTAKAVVSLPAIRRDHLSVSRTKQFPGDLPGAGGRNVEDRHQGRNDDPQPRLVHRLSPGRFIDVGVLRADMLFQFGHRLLQGVGGGPLQLGHHPRRDR